MMHARQQLYTAVFEGKEDLSHSGFENMVFTQLSLISRYRACMQFAQQDYLTIPPNTNMPCDRP